MGKERVKVWAAVAMLVVAGLLILRGCRSAGLEEVTITTHAACAACGWHGQTSLEKRPARCPECKEQAVWPALQCVSCGHVQSIDLVRFNRMGKEPFCTSCNRPGTLRRIQ